MGRQRLFINEVRKYQFMFDSIYKNDCRLNFNLHTVWNVIKTQISAFVILRSHTLDQNYEKLKEHGEFSEVY